MELVPITFNKIMQSKAYTVIILGNESKQFAIYTEPLVGRNLQMLLNGDHQPRPYTHSLIDSIFQGFDIHLKQAVINRIEDTIYFSRLFLEQQVGNENKEILEIDTRPSDCLTLAMMHNAPIYIKKDVFEVAVPIENQRLI
jgi:hypothetical protein